MYNVLIKLFRHNNLTLIIETNAFHQVFGNIDQPWSIMTRYLLIFLLQYYVIFNHRCFTLY